MGVRCNVYRWDVHNSTGTRFAILDCATLQAKISWQIWWLMYHLIVCFCFLFGSNIISVPYKRLQICRLLRWTEWTNTQTDRTDCYCTMISSMFRRLSIFFTYQIISLIKQYEAVLYVFRSLLILNTCITVLLVLTFSVGTLHHTCSAQH